MKISKSQMTLSELIKQKEKKILNFDLIIQRKDSIWDSKRQSMFIHSILSDFPIPPVYAIKEHRILSFIDGKQRLTTCFYFIQDEFTLHKDTPDINGTSLSGKSFSQLPEEMRNGILDFKFEVIKMEDATSNEIEDLFFRLNNGVPLKTIEKTRVLLGKPILTFIQKIADSPFFTQKVYLAKSAKKRYVDQEMILQTLSLIDNRYGFTSKDLQAFASELRSRNLRDSLTAKIDNSTYFLNEVFLRKEKFLKKVNIPIIFKLSYDVKFNNWDITHTQFYEWCTNFFENLPEEYKKASVSGSAKKENVLKRYYIMSSNFENYFKEYIPKNFYTSQFKNK